jgi:3-hydroxymyristoyl/3-hydroxydecanoyl-(acyl carrier protein) dehydratase
MERIYDIQEIMNFLPHRYPFLLVDRILEIVPNEKIVAVKNVTINEPFFQGHFPGAPIMPGVLIRKPVVPGDQLIIEVKVLKMRSKVVKMSGIASVDKKRVAEAEIMATIGEKP